MTDPRKPIFDAVREAKGESLTAADVTALDEALDMIGIPRAGESGGLLRLSDAGVRLIKKWEGFKKDLGNGTVQSYPDPATGGAPWTIGTGLTGPDIVKGTVWPIAYADQRFMQEVEKTYAEAVRRGTVGHPTSQNQFDAMTSLCFNIGGTNFSNSTLLRKHNAGDYAGAAAQFDVWNKAAGKVMQGLVNRRADERKMYEGRT